MITEGISYLASNIADMPDLEQVEKFYREQEGGFPGNELIVHDKLDCRLICEIWCKNKEDAKTLVKTIPVKYSHLVKVRTKYPKIQCDILGYQKYLDTISLPFMISFDFEKSGLYQTIYPYKSKKRSSWTFVKRTMKIASLDDATIDKLDTKKKVEAYFVKNKLFSYYFENRGEQKL